MNPHRKALLAARAEIDEGRGHFICLSFDTAPGRLDGPAICDLVERIHNELASGADLAWPSRIPATLEDWLINQGIYATRDQLHMARLAWIDRMLEDYP